MSGPWTTSINYTVIDATYGDTFVAFSPNHPLAANDSVLVRSGASIPGIPKHNAKLQLDYQWSNAFSLGANANYGSGVYLRGDEANLDKKTNGYINCNAWASWQVMPALALQLEIYNVFDRENERFGLYGEPDEVIDNIDDNPRFLSPAAPRSANVSLRFDW